MNQDRLRRCSQCGELEGEALTHDWDGWGYIPVQCLCRGIVCRYCHHSAVRRPLSNYHDERTKKVWHVPWFGFMVACRQCRACMEASAARG